jgi:hypothetical protein
LTKRNMAFGPSLKNPKLPFFVLSAAWFRSPMRRFASSLGFYAGLTGHAWSFMQGGHPKA